MDLSRPPLKAVAGLAFVLTLSCAVPALAQERILVIARSHHFGDTIFEVDTAEASFGAIRRLAQLPSDYRGLTPVAGGRFLISSTPKGLGLFDSRAFSFFTVPQWAPLQASLNSFDSDALRPRIFYRTASEFGVMEAPSFIPRVLGATGDVVFGWLSVKYVASRNMLLIPQFISYTQAKIVAFDADSGAIRGTIDLADGWPRQLLVDAGSRVHVLGFFGGHKIQTYDLDTFALVNETSGYPADLPPWLLIKCASKSSYRLAT